MKYDVLLFTVVIIAILSLLVPINSVYASGVKPGKPTDVTATQSSKATISVSWKAPTDEGESPISGYQIEKIDGTSSVWTILTTNTGSTSTSYNDFMITKDTNYMYRIRAVNDKGPGQPSDYTSLWTQGSSSIFSGDTRPPSFIKLFSENEYPLTIDGKGFKVSPNVDKVNTVKLEPGFPIQLKILVSDNEGPSNIWSVLINTNLRGAMQLHQSDTSIMYKKNNPLQVIDPNEFFSNVNVHSSTINDKLELVFDITFAKEIKKSDIIIQVNDRSMNSRMFKVSDAWEISKGAKTPKPLFYTPEIKENSLMINKNKFTILQDELAILEISVNIEKYLQRTPLELKIFNPDGTQQVTRLLGNSDGQFFTSKILDKTWKKGDYTINAVYNGFEIGTVSFSINNDFEQTKSIEQTTIPSWIKNTAKWWAEEKIRNEDFLKGIQYLVDEKVMFFSKTKQISHISSFEIPEWLKTNAGWWAEGLISDKEFVNGFQYVVQL